LIVNPKIKSMATETVELKICPECKKDWTEAEINYQCCDACGYPLSAKELTAIAQIEGESHD
jgi:predicted amidophosphoribosyltransferase